jgi:hypothetical protein
MTGEPDSRLGEAARFVISSPEERLFLQLERVRLPIRQIRFTETESLRRALKFVARPVCH